MLEAATSLATSALISFVPRQVMLVSKPSVASVGKIKDKEMEAEKKKKKSTAKPTETVEENGSNAPTTLAHEDRAKGLLFSSIEAFLGSSGLNQTLAVFRSEAQLESNGLKASSINLEELFCRILGFSEGDEEANVGWLKDLQKTAVSKVDGSENAQGASDGSQKKRKNRKKNAEGSKTMTDEQGSENCNNELNGLADANDVKKPNSGEDSCIDSKKKKKKKHSGASDAFEEKAEREDSKKLQEIVEEKIGELKSLIDTCSLPMEPNAKHKGEKEKKAKANSDSLVENGNFHTKDDPNESNPVKDKSSISGNDAKDVKKCKSAEESCSETKEKKKNKHKVSSDASEEKAECGDYRKLEEKVELKFLIDTSTLPAESTTKHKGEKKKKVKAISDALVENGNEHIKDDTKESDPVKEKSSVSGNDGNSEKKSQKKRKRVASEEKELQGENKTVTKELTDAGNNTESGTLEKLGKSLQENEQTPAVKKRKTDKSSDVHDVQKDSGEDQLLDGNVEKNKEEGGTASKSKKSEKPSAEPKSVNAFQRVKIDEVKFADDRLQDNSYWALDDTGSGYGAKAQEVLGQVRGRDFRHEKTKKKRGTYRGGQIDLHSKSIKFNYGDEE